MQGRLLPKFMGNYQAHPVDYWDQEFTIASLLGIDCIEFILDYYEVEKNPLMSKSGVDKILQVSEKTNVVVETVCADYFMEAPLHHEDKITSRDSVDILVNLIENMQHLGATILVMPCVDGASLSSPIAVQAFVDRTRSILPELEINNVNLSIETDLPPKLVVELLDRINSQRVSINYDTGNSASLGYDPSVEIDMYGSRISNVHIKDRLLDGGSVPLGQGAAQFEIIFSKLRGASYHGPLIMQVYRDEDGIEIFRQQMAWIRPLLGMLDG